MHPAKKLRPVFDIKYVVAESKDVDLFLLSRTRFRRENNNECTQT
jgi:hypothetical protein